MNASHLYLLAPALAFAGSLASAAAASAAPLLDPSGVWLTEDGRARIRTEKCGTKQDRVCGYVVWLKSTTTDEGKPLVDVSNPDPKKRSRPSLGLQIMLGLAPNLDDARYEGKIYNAEDGKNYDVSIWLDGQNTLNVRGCLISFLCKTQSWTRMKDPAAGQLVGPTGSPTGPRAEPEWATASNEAADATRKASAATARP